MLLNHSFKVLPGAGQSYGLAANTVAVIFAVPRDWLGKTVIFNGEGCQIYGAFDTGTATDPDLVAAARGNAGTVASNVLTPAPLLPLLVNTGASEAILIPKTAKFMKIVNDNATGFWSAYLSDTGRFA